MTRGQWWGVVALVVAPILVCVALNQIELALRDNSVQASGGGTLSDATKRVLDMETDLAKLFIGFATSVIGGLAYYVKSRRTDFGGSLSPFVLAGLIAALVACIASIFFGQLWISGVVKELAGHTFDPSMPNSEVAIPQAGQYFTFIAALIWASIVVIAQERHRVTASGSDTAPVDKHAFDDQSARGGETDAPA